MVQDRGAGARGVGGTGAALCRHTVVALFEDTIDAEHAIVALRKSEHPAEQVSLLSEHVTLEPGDVLLTGTPAGVGMASGTYLKVGDRIDATITGLGTLSVAIVPDEKTAWTPAAG